jgi:RNA polymerase sigma-70 factor (ECF subfamily)
MPDQRSERTDEALLSRALEGDRGAFGLLYERYLDPLYRYIFYRTGEPKDAEDLTELTFLKAWEQLPALGRREPIRNFRAWIYRISHNLVVDHYRTRRRVVPLEAGVLLSSKEDEPAEQVEAGEERKQLAHAISQLEPILQQVIVARFINTLSHAETAEIIGKSEGHVRVLQYRALKKLKQLLDKGNGENA